MKHLLTIIVTTLLMWNNVEAKSPTDKITKRIIDIPFYDTLRVSNDMIVEKDFSVNKVIIIEKGATLTIFGDLIVSNSGVLINKGQVTCENLYSQGKVVNYTDLNVYSSFYSSSPVNNYSLFTYDDTKYPEMSLK